MRCSNRRTNICQFMTITLLLFFLFLPLSVKADTQYCVQYNIQNVPSPLTPNQTVPVQATLKNCGSLTWTKDKFTLSYHWYSGNNVAFWDGERSFLPYDVSPGGTVPLTAKVTTQSSEGTYTLKWDMCHEGVTWFSFKGNSTKDQSVEVKSSVVSEVKRSLSPRLPLGIEKVNVISSLSALWTALTTPDIKSVPYQPLKPEGEYVIGGSSFGSNLGQVKMTLPSGKTINLVPIKWWNDIIHVKVSTVIGEMDGTASIQVETARGIASNKFSVKFEATRDIAILPDSLLQVDCADPGGSYDNCTAAPARFGVTINAWHGSWCCIHGDHETDKFWTKAPLKNGWIVSDYEFDHGGDGNIIQENFIGMGTTSMFASIEWSDDYLGFVDYWYTVRIAGPKGVPYQ